MNISKQAMNAYHSNLSKLQGSAKKTFEKLVNASLKVNPDMSDDEFMELVGNSLISTTLSYGDAAGSVALDFFEEYTGLDAKNTDIAKVPYFVNDKYREKVAQYAANNTLRDDEFMEACGNILQSEVLQQANRTMSNVGKRHGLKFARVPQGGECAFCAMLASRGFVYSAEGANSHYHNHCRCKVVAGRPNTKVDGYKPELIRKRIAEVAKSIQIDPNDKMNEKAILSECARRDTDWLYGRTPKVTFTSKEVEEDIKKHHQKELESAKRMVRAGVPCCFQQDYEYFTDTDNLQKRRGKADFTGGLELKVLDGASEYSTIDGYLKGLKRKKDCTWIIFDNSINPNMPDEILADYITRSKRFKNGRIYYFGKDFKVHFVK